MKYRLTRSGGRARYSGADFSLWFDPRDPEGTAEGEAGGEVDLTYFRLMDLLREAVFHEGATNWVSARTPG